MERSRKMSLFLPDLLMSVQCPLPGPRILSAGRIIEVNLKSIKWTTVNKSLTKMSRTWERERNRIKETRRVEISEKFLSALGGSPKMCRQPVWLHVRRFSSAVHMEVKLDNNAESAKACSDCRKTPTRSDVILIAFVSNELKYVKIFALRDFVTEAHVWRSAFPQTPSLSFSYCFVSLRVWSSLFAAPCLVGGEKKNEKMQIKSGI